MNRPSLSFPVNFGMPALGLGLLALAGALACGGTGSSSSSAVQQNSAPTVATSLSYTAPSSTGYRLVADASSTPTTLVLNLVGPTGASVRGVTFNLSTSAAKAAWVAPAGGTTLIKPGGVLNLGTGLPLMQSKVSGQELNVSLFQKGATAAATLDGSPIFSVALSLKTGATAGPVSLIMRPGCEILGATGTSTTIQVAVGEVVAH